MALKLCLLVLGITGLLYAEPLRVGLVGQQPYVLQTGHQLQGIAMDVWNLVAGALNLPNQIQYFSEPNKALEQLKNHQVDVLIGPIAITAEQAKTVLFTQPYQRAELGLAVLDGSISTWSRVSTQAKTIMAMVLIAFLLAILVAFVIWSLEHQRNPTQFSKNRKHGIGDAIWFSLVTMMGVGYGDKVPVTFLGRSTAVVWMVIGIILFSSVTAGITTFLTVSSIPYSGFVGLTFFEGAHIAVYSPLAVDLVETKMGAQPKIAQGAEQAFEWLQNGQVKGIVADRTELLYYLKSHQDMRATVTQTNIDVAHYGLLFRPEDKQLYQKVNVELLKLVENGSINRVMSQWTE